MSEKKSNLTHIRKARFGFTLIELLVVIAIIAMLASIIMASLSSARAKSRDAKRLADLKQLQTALELYYADNGKYPIVDQTSTPTYWWGTCSGRGSKDTSGSNGWIPDLAPKYISKLPTDPKPIGTGGCYIYTGRNGGKNYMILANTTVETAPTPADNRALRLSTDGNTTTCPPTDNGYSRSFAIYTPGGRCY